ncbi:MAG: hypothetical protein Ct9H90mP27_1610 [Gammaproteobacteria bacterium]|nr:MAG: hypothetical protein Ct9H90mP27_1610 [Gammaproteobacteria bacterium]
MAGLTDIQIFITLSGKRLPHSVYSQDSLNQSSKQPIPNRKNISIVTVGPRPLMVMMKLCKLGVIKR